jgi:uncharacterized protein
MACKSKIFKKALFLFLLVWAYPSYVMAVTPPLPSHPSQYVMDLAGVMPPDTRARLNAMLRDLENKTTAQVVVLTLISLEGEPIESFSHETAVKWGIGKKGKDNGVLLTVAVKDRKYRFEVGYGLESSLPDSLVGSIGRQYLVPRFRKGDFAGGIAAAVTEISSKIAAGPGAEVAPAHPGEEAPPKERGGSSQVGLIILILSFIAAPIIIIWLIARRIKKSGTGYAGGGYWYGGGGGWSSGGGDSGGFSGGGGDFGGGGSSGDW